jgi:hypothetical protein
MPYTSRRLPLTARLPLTRRARQKGKGTTSVAPGPGNQQVAEESETSMREDTVMKVAQ